MIQLVDELGVKLDVGGDRGILSSSSLVLAVRTVDGANFPTTSVNIFDTSNVQVTQLRVYVDALETFLVTLYGDGTTIHSYQW